MFWRVLQYGPNRVPGRRLSVSGTCRGSQNLLCLVVQPDKFGSGPENSFRYQKWKSAPFLPGCLIINAHAVRYPSTKQATASALSLSYMMKDSLLKCLSVLDAKKAFVSALDVGINRKHEYVFLFEALQKYRYRRRQVSFSQWLDLTKKHVRTDGRCFECHRFVGSKYWNSESADALACLLRVLHVFQSSVYRDATCPLNETSWLLFDAGCRED